MKNTREAIRYGIETLGVTPEEFFSLIESSNGYSGDDYGRWLANEIIKIAEKDNVGYSQLLVKKFSIIQSLIEESDAEIKEEWVNTFKEMLGTDNIYSTNFEHLGTMVEDVDWFNGIDYDEVNSYFVDEVLPDELADSIKNNDDVAIITQLSNAQPIKGSDMFKGAKDYNIVCKNEGSLYLYRMCSIVKAFNSGKNFKFGFFTSVDFLTNPDNTDIIRHFLNYFNYKGVVIKSTELLADTYISNKFAFVVCTPRFAEEPIQDGFVLDEVTLGEDGEFNIINTKRYSRSSKDMLQSIIDNTPECNARVFAENNGKVDSTGAYGYKGAYGYLNLGNAQEVWLTCHPDMSAKKYIPIIDSNLNDIIVYYAVTKSLSNFGFSNEINNILTGSADYNNLLYNCLPLFLFNTDSKFRDYGTVNYKGSLIRLESAFDVENSDLIADLLEKGEVYFSFEAKELLNTCKGFLDYLKNELKQSIMGLSFEEIRVEANHPELNETYVTALTNLKDYIKTLYRKME